MLWLSRPSHPFSASFKKICSGKIPYDTSCAKVHVVDLRVQVFSLACMHAISTCGLQHNQEINSVGNQVDSDETINDWISISP